MPPEQVSGNANAMGPACDIYSLGVILYELVSGRLPFRGDSMAMLSQVLLDEPPPPSGFVPPSTGAGKHLPQGDGQENSTVVTPRWLSWPRPCKTICAGKRDAETGVRARGESGPAHAKRPRHRGVRASRGATPEPSRRIKAEQQPTRHRQRGRFVWLWIAGGAAGVLLLAGLFVLLLKFNKPSAGNPPSQPAKAGTANGSVPLLHANESSDWELGSGDPTVWSVADGAMVFNLSDPPLQRGWLVTRRDYTDFRLRFEFQLQPGAKSGIGLRMWPGSPKPLEIQIQDDTFPAFAGQRPLERTGTLHGLAGRPAELRPLGEWNQMEIELRGWSLRVAVNDKESLRIPAQRRQGLPLSRRRPSRRRTHRTSTRTRQPTLPQAGNQGSDRGRE